MSNDRILAQRMLEVRRQGYTFGLFFRQSASGYLRLVVSGAIGLTILALSEIWVAFWLGLGMFVGAVARDIGRVRATRRSWPFSEKITDWKKVEALAEERS